MSGGRPLVVGRAGQVATALRRILPDAAYTDRETLDLERATTIVRALDEFRPSVVVNPGAYTAVDLAESEPDRAFAINAGAPGRIAAWCAANDVPLIHFSTDYVYPGSGSEPWREIDPTGPVNVYGRSKLAGEGEVAAARGAHVILRTSWVYSDVGKNFVRAMLELGGAREGLRVVNDQVGAPTSAADLASAVRDLIAHPGLAGHRGTYNVANSGDVSWAGFAREIFSGWRARGHALKVREVSGIATSEYPTPAARPRNSRLNCDLLAGTFGIRLGPRAAALDSVLGHLERPAPPGSGGPRAPLRATRPGGTAP